MIYVLAYTVVWFCWCYFTKKLLKIPIVKEKKVCYVILGSAFGGLLKYACHVIAGGVFWLNQGSSFWGINDDSWLYSFIYNGAYCIPNIIICGAVMVIFALYYDKLLFPNDISDLKEE